MTPKPTLEQHYDALLKQHRYCREQVAAGNYWASGRLAALDTELARYERFLRAEARYRQTLRPSTRPRR